MTNQYNSENELFDKTDDFDLAPRSHRKTNSFGPILPVNFKNNRMSTQGSGKGKSSQNAPQTPERSGAPEARTPPKAAGSTLGFGSGLAARESQPYILEGKNATGEDVSIDIFHSVFQQAIPSSQLETILNHLHWSSQLDFSSFIENISYQGFDRHYYIKAALKRVSVETFCRFAILGAVRGSNFTKILETCISMPQELVTAMNNNVVIKKAKRRDDLTILRFTASIPHWVAFWLFTVNMDKKIPTEACPGWLQFPGAASLPMGKTQRIQHISFCKAFSALLPGGSFNGNIYYTAYRNQIPVKDVPKMIKDGLGISETDTTSGTITDSDVQDLTTKVVARA